jgi:hypothetical protein
MKQYIDGLAILLASAWVGSMWATGYIAAPVLFYFLEDKMLAGMLAGKLFSVTEYTGIVCALYLLVWYTMQYGKTAWNRRLFWLIAAMLLLTLLGQFGIQPILAQLKEQALPQYVMQSVFAARFEFWHGVASILFLIQSLAGAVLLLKLNGLKNQRAPQQPDEK